jgi:hypothetical protein
MTAFVIPIVVVAILVGLGFAFGGPALAVLLALAAVVAIGWVIAVALSRKSAADVTRRAERSPEFLGPGGPDDPTR